MEDQKLIVLILGNNQSDIDQIRDNLEEIEEFEFELLLYTDIERGMQEIRRRIIDLIFLNYRFEGVSGLEVLGELRESGDKRPVIMLIPQSDEKSAGDAMRVGADDYLIKEELSPELMRYAIDSVISRFRIQQEKAILSEELRQSQKMEAIGQLAGGIAHDFNNMLMGIVGFTELAILKSKGRDIEQDLQRIHKICERMAELIQKLLSFSRRKNIEQSKINLKHALKELEIILTHTISKEIELNIELPEDEMTVHANVSLLHQVLLNICRNATEAMPDGGLLTISAKYVDIGTEKVLVNSALKLDRYVLLEVHDTGKGISPENLDRIFEPFFTTKKLGKDKGTGLGLTIAWQDIKDMGGVINVYSELNRGSIFKIYLPAPEVVKKKIYEADKIDIPLGRGESILVVDDEQIILEVASQILQRLGYNVYAASNGRDAISIFKELHKELSVVLLDVSMPLMSGENCFNSLISIDKEVKVLFASGQEIKSESKKLISKGAKGVIQKPYQLQDLAQRIRMVIDI